MRPPVLPPPPHVQSQGSGGHVSEAEQRRKVREQLGACFDLAEQELRKEGFSEALPFTPAEAGRLVEAELFGVSGEAGEGGGGVRGY